MQQREWLITGVDGGLAWELARAVLRAMDAEQSPLLLRLGRDALRREGARRRARIRGVERWAAVGARTDFPEEPTRG